MSYQRTNASDNLPVGTPNSPVDINGGQAQTFVFSVNPISSFSQEIPMIFSCTNTTPAPVFMGVNTFLLTANSEPLADMLTINDTTSHDGNIVIPNPTGTGLIATASINLRACPTIQSAR
jgi:hypothetical protein